MTLETIAGNLVDALDFKTLVAWADMLKVDHFGIMGDPLDDELPDQEDKLRVAVTEAMLGIGKKTEPFKGKEKNPMPLGEKK